MTIKVAFLALCPFGIYGTPGTYRFVELIGKCCVVRAFARAPSDVTVYIPFRVPGVSIVNVLSALKIQRLLPIFDRKLSIA